AGASASGAGRAVDVARAVAGGAGLVELHGERPAGAAEGFLERDLHLGLDVVAAGASPAGATQEVVEVDSAAASGPAPCAGAPAPAHAAPEITEDGAEEIREVRLRTGLYPEAAALLPTRLGVCLSVALPVGTKAVVAASFL